MKCTDVRAALPLLIYADAGPQDAALREHLATCADCRREHEALSCVRRLLDEVPVPRVAVDLPQLHRSLMERQLRRARRVAMALGAVAAVLLLTIGLRMEVRLEGSQLIVRWGDPVTSATDVPPAVGLIQRDAGPTVPPESLDAELRVLSDLIHALKTDADERDQRYAEQLDRLERHVRALQSQADLRWSATEENVAALYLLSRKGEKP